MKYKTGIGIDSHRFVEIQTDRMLMLGGLSVENEPALAGNSDADVILHALTDAISGITGYVVIGKVADRMCKQGITDSRAYLAEAQKSLGDWVIEHVSIAVECLRPKLEERSEAICQSIADLLSLSVSDVCLTATTGEGLSDFGKGMGIQATVIVTACLTV